MTTVYWTVKYKDKGFYVIDMWTKPNRVDVMTFKSVTMDSEKLRNKIVSMIGNPAFKMEYIKTQWSEKN